MQVSEKRRQHRIPAIRLPDILIVGQMIRIDWLHLARQPIQSEQLPRVAHAAEVAEPGKDSQCCR